MKLTLANTSGRDIPLGVAIEHVRGFHSTRCVTVQYLSPAQSASLTEQRDESTKQRFAIERWQRHVQMTRLSSTTCHANGHIQSATSQRTSACPSPVER